MSYVNLLKKEIVETLSQYKPIDLKNRADFLENLIFLYYTMKASRHLLVAAGMYSKGPLQQYYLHHSEQERDHDKWLAEDLKSEGVDVKTQLIPYEAVEMCGSLYYLIYQVDAACLLGYTLMMEGSPATKEQIESLEAIHGKTLLRTARYHALHDIGHAADIGEQIAMLPEERRWIVSQTAIKSAHYFGKAMNRIGGL